MTGPACESGGFVVKRDKDAIVARKIGKALTLFQPIYKVRFVCFKLL
jgi:hypothetical protein